MKKLLNRLRGNGGKRDRADAVLTTTIISIPLLVMVFSFATGISLATWQKTSYISAAQAAATASLQSVQSDGYLGVNTMNSFVSEYLSQTGRTTELLLQNADGSTSNAAGQGTGASETEAFTSDQCSTAIINGVERQLPYIETSLDITRGTGESTISTYPYWNEGSTLNLQNPVGGHGTVVDGQQYRVINAKVWEASKNITWWIIPSDAPGDLECQPYNVDVSAILFGNNEDLTEGQTCFQPDYFPVDGVVIKEITTTPTILYESPLATCTSVISNLRENSIVTVIGSYRTWSFVETPNGTQGWVPTSRLQDTQSWDISYDMGCDAYGCGTTENALPSSYNWSDGQEAIVLENPTKNYFNFGGWQQYNCDTNADIGIVQAPMTISFGSYGNLCFRAEFTIKSFWVTWDANGGNAGGVAPVEYPYNSTVTVPPNATKPGYTSQGWYTAPTGGTRVSGTITVGNGDMHFYQHYTATVNSVSVNRNGGTGGSVTPSTYSINESSAQTFQLTRPTRAGYSFSSWSVTSGTGSVNNTTNVLTVPAGGYGNVVVRANWSASSNSITVDANGGTGGNASPSSYTISSSSRTVNLTVPSRPGYYFNQWTITTDSSGSSSSVSGNVLTIPAGAYGAITVRANWSAIPYDIILDKDGGVGGAANSTYTTSSSTQTKNLGTPSKSAYQFTGWTKVSGPGSISGSTLQIPANSTGNISVKANWAEIFSVTINKNGGSGGANSTTYYVRSNNQTISLGAPTRAGYSFSGWSTNGAGSWVSGNTLTIPANGEGNITVNANWTGNNYSISMNNNGGSGGTANPFSYQTRDSSRNVTLLPPTRNGYSVSSYTITTNSSGGSSTVSGNTLTIPANAYGNITVRANWSANSYNINYQCTTPSSSSCSGSASGSGNVVSYTYSASNQTKNLGSPPSSNGWTFNGWSRVSGPNVSFSGNTMTIPGDSTGTITVKANWRKNNSNTVQYGASLSWYAYCQGSCYAYATWSWSCPSGGGFIGGGISFYDTYANAWGSGWSGAQSGTMYVGLTNTSSRVGLRGGVWGTCQRTDTWTSYL